MKRALTTLVILWIAYLLGLNVGTAQTAKTSDVLVVKSGEMPLYPHLARAARLEGTVRLEVATDGVSVAKVAATGAPKLLMEAAEQNVKTWQFYTHRPQTFTVIFVYKLEKQEVSGFANPTLLLELPNRVEVRTKLPTVEAAEGH